jgi:hypothetical protein
LDKHTAGTADSEPEFVGKTCRASEEFSDPPPRKWNVALGRAGPGGALNEVRSTFAGRHFHHQETVALLVFARDRMYRAKGKRFIQSAPSNQTNSFGNACYGDRIQHFRSAHVILANTVDKDATFRVRHSAEILSHIVILARWRELAFEVKPSRLFDALLYYQVEILKILRGKHILPSPPPTSRGV